MRKLLLAALVVPTVFLSTAALSQSDDGSKDNLGTADNTATVSVVFGRFGFSSNPDTSPSSCKVEMQLNQATFVKHIDELKAIGLLNSELTQTTVNLMPNTLSMAFAMEIVPVATKEIFERNQDINRCQFFQKVTITDDYGNDKSVLMFSYWFTRELYKKINWDNFPAQNMPKVAPKFQFSREFALMTMGER
ncbi:MAG: hypothetical protein ACLQKK_09675 [Rhodomicrobium sp.]